MYMWSQLQASFSLLVIFLEQEVWHLASPDMLARASANPEPEPSPIAEPTRTAEVLPVLYMKLLRKTWFCPWLQMCHRQAIKKALVSLWRGSSILPSISSGLCDISADKEQASDSLLKWRERTSLTSAGLRTGSSVLSWPLSSHLEKWLIRLSLPTDSRSNIPVQIGWSGCFQVRPLFKS